MKPLLRQSIGGQPSDIARIQKGERVVALLTEAVDKLIVQVAELTARVDELEARKAKVKAVA